MGIVGRRTSLCLQSFSLLNELIPFLYLIEMPWAYFPQVPRLRRFRR